MTKRRKRHSSEQSVRKLLGAEVHTHSSIIGEPATKVAGSFLQTGRHSAPPGYGGIRPGI